MSEGHDHGVQVGPVMVFSARRAEVEAFYRGLGLTGDGGGDETWLEGANAKLVVHGRAGAQTPSEVAAQGGFVVWFGVADVHAAYERARKAGAAASDFFGDYFFARDPDGRYVGIYTLEEHGHAHDHEH